MTRMGERALVERVSGNGIGSRGIKCFVGSFWLRHGTERGLRSRRGNLDHMTVGPIDLSWG